jgi:transposase
VQVSAGQAPNSKEHMIAAVIERCVGIDVGKKTVAACVMVGPSNGEARSEVRLFGTTVAQLQQLREWIQQEQCTHAIMESTGSYWKPVFNILEQSVKVALANPHEVKARKGHKTDAKDAWWLAHLLRHGMITPSFIPPRGQRELRDLTRRRKKLLSAATSEKNRVAKILEDANVKLGSVLSDLFGVSGQLMLEALLGRQSGAGGGGWVCQRGGEKEDSAVDRGFGSASHGGAPSPHDPLQCGASTLFGGSDCGIGQCHRRADWQGRL